MSRTGKRAVTLFLAALALFVLGGAVTALAGTEISVVKLTCDEAALQLSTAYTEGEMRTRFHAAAGVTTAGCEIDKLNSGVWYTVNGAWYGIGDGTAQVSTEKDYAYHYNLELKDGYDWNSKIKSCTTMVNVTDCPGLTVYLNGAKRTDATIRWNPNWNTLEIHIPAPKPSDEPIVTGIEVWGDGLTMAYGTSHTFKASVSGTVTNKKVSWSLKGAKNTGTKITSAGKLTISKNETAKALTVRATAAADKTKYAEIKIKTGAFKQITSIALTFNEEGIHLSTDSTEKEVASRVTGNIGIASAGCTLDYGYMQYLKDGGVTGIGTGKVKPDRQYTFSWTLTAQSGYAWSEGTLNNSIWNGIVPLSQAGDLTVTVNGAAWKDVLISYNPFAHKLDVFVPAPANLPEIDFTEAKVTGVVAKTYTGKIIRQDPTVTLNGKTLVKGTDYKITYTNNKNAGKATMKLTGLGRYKGVITKQFTIKPVKIKKAVLEYTSKAYAGKYLKPKATVTAEVDGVMKTLKAGTDYTLTYEDNRNAGKATVTVKGTGNYYGTIVKHFTIKPVKIAKAVLEYTKAKYTGKALKPAVTVTAAVNGETVTLKKTRDYTVTYADNKNVGTATVTVTGVGNFTGTIVKTFKIVK